MKLKSFLIVSIILCIITIGAVSASENITDDELTVNEEIDSVEESQDISNEEILELDEDADELDDDYESDDFRIYVNNVTLGGPETDYEDIMVSITCQNSPKGNISISLNETEVFNKELEYYNYITLYDLKPKIGVFNISIINIINETSTKHLYTGLLSVDYYLDIDSGTHYDSDEDYYSEVLYYNKWAYYIGLPNDATGNLYVSFNGETPKEVTYEKYYLYSRYSKKISVEGLSIGEHKITARLLNDPKYPDKTVEYTFTVIPKISAPEYISVGEKEFVTVNLPQNYNGVVRIYNGTYESGYDSEDDWYENYTKGQLIGSANVVNGLAKIPLANLVGDLIYINCTGSGDCECIEYIDCVKNSPKFNAKINSESIEVGQDVILTVTAPISDDPLRIYVDNNLYKELNLDKTAFTEYISKLSVGEHHIKLIYAESYDDEDDSSNDYYSNSFYVTVKEKQTQPTNPVVNPTVKVDKIKLALKKVKVKKSAKKLIIKATLKINGKKVKGKKVTLKFNGKKFKVKTNKKGVATFKIPKKVLKKLKVGKKIKYQVSYGKKTAKRTVKVKK